jgi:hypothetical protein
MCRRLPARPAAPEDHEAWRSTSAWGYGAQHQRVGRSLTGSATHRPRPQSSSAFPAVGEINHSVRSWMSWALCQGTGRSHAAILRDELPAASPRGGNHSGSESAVASSTVRPRTCAAGGPGVDDSSRVQLHKSQASNKVSPSLLRRSVREADLDLTTNTARSPPRRLHEVRAEDNGERRRTRSRTARA